MAQHISQLLDINQLQTNPYQPRAKTHKEDLKELAQSIKAHGILEPLVVANTPAGYQIIAGERRWRAAKLVGLTEVPVVIRRTTPKGMLEMALIENVQRIDLNSIERAKAFLQLQQEFAYTTTQLAEKIGKSSPYISNTMKLLSLPDAIKDGVVSGQITEGHARALAGIPDHKAMLEMYKRVLKESASVRRTEELVRFFVAQKETGDEPKTGRGARSLDEKTISDWQKSVEAILSSKPTVKLTRSHRQTRITIFLKGTEEKTEPDLQRLLNMFEREAN